MSDDELLDVIRRTRDANASRLAYAAVLSRRGNARGEFIALACDNAERRTRGDLGNVYVAQCLREWALLREHRSSFLSAMGLVEAKHTHYRWQRGFVSEVATMPGPLLEMAPALLRLPIDLLQLSYPEQKDVANVIDAGVLSAAPKLMIDQVSPVADPLDAEGVSALVGALPTSGLESLSLCLRRFPGGIGTVSGAPGVAGVRSLRLGDDLGAAALLTAVGTFGSALRELTLTTDRVPLDTYRQLLCDPSLAAVESLSVLSFSNDEGDVIARAVASAELPRLTSLFVMDLSPESVDALVSAPIVAGLRSLKLRNANVDGRCLRMLLERAPALEELSLLGVAVDQSGVEAIASYAPSSLRRLVLDTGSRSLDLRPLVMTSRYVLREIDLVAEGMNDDLLAALAVSPFADRVASLTFAGPVTMRGARALAASRDLAFGLAVTWRMHTDMDEAMKLIHERFPLASHTM